MFGLVNWPRGVSVGYGEGGAPGTAVVDPKAGLFIDLDGPGDVMGPSWALGMNTGLNCAVPGTPVLYGFSRI